MKPLPASLRVWNQDIFIRRVIKNSGYLFSSNTISAFLSMVQSAYAAQLLGVDGFAVLGIVTVFTSNVNRLFSFRMGELVLTYAGGYVAEKKPQHAAAVIKAAGLAEAIISLVAFVILVLAAPLGARFIAHDASLAPLFIFYGITILGNLMTETATGVLQIGDHYRSQAFINVLQSVLTAAIIVAAYYLKAGLVVVVGAYLLGKIILGMGPIILAFRRMPELVGKDWWKAPFSLLPPWAELRRFALSTNLSATVNLVARDSEILWIGLFLSNAQVGYYKVAAAIIGILQSPIAPLTNTTFLEIRQTIATRQWSRVNDLLRKMTLATLAWTVLSGAGLLVAGRWIIQILYGAEFIPAFPALMVLLVGYGFANIFFWNRTLILSLGDAVYPFQVTFWAGLGKVALMFLLLPRFGYVAEAALLSLFFIVSIGMITLRGRSMLRRAIQEQPGEASV